VSSLDRSAALPRLSRATLPPALSRPGGPAPPPGIVHLGLGNFARAHTAVYTASALATQPGDWGMVGAGQRSRAVAGPLAAQDLLYTVLTLAPARVEAEIPTVLSDVLVAADSPQQLLDHLAAPDTRIITLTVTEKGYSYSAATLGLDLDDPAVRADVEGGPPRTVIGQVVRGLQRRARTHRAPVTVLSCDNLAANGERTRQLVHEFAAALPALEGGELIAWIDEAVSFPSTVVDRIVPATTSDHRRMAAEALGLRDEVPVPTEPFSMWVLQDRFAAGRPAWEAGGAIFTDDVHGYELLKLRLLNGTHSLIAYLGMLSGQRYIAGAVRQPAIEKAARAAMDEYLPTLDVPGDVDLPRYVEQLFERFGNTAIAHPTTQVGSDGSLKLPVRVTEPALYHLDRGLVPRVLALTVAGYVACLAYPAGYGRTVGTVSDPAGTHLAELGARHGEPGDLVRAVFEEARIFAPALSERTEFLDAVAELLGTLRRHGVGAAVDEATAGSAR
jgi:fructuronate reductase